MKICPLCKTKFSDDAEFCPSCKAELQDFKEVEKAEKQPIPKKFWWSLIATCGFIGAMYLIYHLVYSAIYL